MLHRLCKPPSVLLSSNLAAVLLRRSVYVLTAYKLILFHTIDSRIKSLQNTHKSGRGLRGYLIPVAPHAFALQRRFFESAAFAFGTPLDIKKFDLYFQCSALFL